MHTVNLTDTAWVAQTVGFDLVASDGTVLGFTFRFAGRWSCSALNADGTRTHFPSQASRRAAKVAILTHHS